MRSTRNRNKKRKFEEISNNSNIIVPERQTATGRTKNTSSSPKQAPVPSNLIKKKATGIKKMKSVKENEKSEDAVAITNGKSDSEPKLEPPKPSARATRSRNRGLAASKTSGLDKDNSVKGSDTTGAVRRGAR